MDRYLITQFKITSKWFLSILKGIAQHHGSTLITSQANSLEWLAGHLITGRYRNIQRLGITIEEYQHLHKFIDLSIPPPHAITFDHNSIYPSLLDSTGQWEIYSTVFLEKLENSSTAEYNIKIPFTLPFGGDTVGDALHFMVLHESYHLGQMNLIRKALGYTSAPLLT